MAAKKQRVVDLGGAGGDAYTPTCTVVDRADPKPYNPDWRGDWVKADVAKPGWWLGLAPADVVTMGQLLRYVKTEAGMLNLARGVVSLCKVGTEIRLRDWCYDCQRFLTALHQAGREAAVNGPHYAAGLGWAAELGLVWLNNWARDAAKPGDEDDDLAEACHVTLRTTKTLYANKPG